MDYKSAGVNIDKADGLISDVKRMAQSTYDANVLSGVGGFGALYELKNYREPVLVSGTDGVGTKVLLAHQIKEYAGLGNDLVAMCVDDVVCSGAKPLFFIDYLAVGKLEDDVYLTLVQSITEACKSAECALIGGETAELPGMYPPDEFDLAGFTVGVVEKSEIIKPDYVREGDVVIGIESSGFHSNGFSLVREAVRQKGLDLHRDYGFGELGKALLTPTRIYAPVLLQLLKRFPGQVHGISHITGGGIPGNLNRVLPPELDAKVDKTAWTIPPVMEFIVREGEIAESEAYKVFNMGIGMAVIAARESAATMVEFLNAAEFRSHVIGETVSGNGKIVF